MNIIGIIPARYASTRFPGKPLVSINGMTMIQRVYTQSHKASSLSDVIVATDDQRIYDHVVSFGGKVMMTAAYHRSGTERCAEILDMLLDINPLNNIDAIINIQGDEPFIEPSQIDKLAACLEDKEIGIATLGKILSDEKELFSPNVVKLLPGPKARALYFSRSAIPYLRNIPQELWITTHQFIKHIGIYAYRADILREIVRLQPSPLEMAESLEQLRWLENGYPLGFALTDIESIAIDSPEDLSKILNINS